MTEIEKLLGEAEQYAADFERFVARAGPDYPKQRVIGLLREMSDALRQHATALEIGRAMGREEAIELVERHFGQTVTRLSRSTLPIDHAAAFMLTEMLSESAKRIRALSPILDVEGMVVAMADLMYRYNNPTGTGAGKSMYIGEARAVLASLTGGAK